MQFNVFFTIVLSAILMPFIFRFVGDPEYREHLDYKISKIVAFGAGWAGLMLWSYTDPAGAARVNAMPWYSIFLFIAGGIAFHYSVIFTWHFVKVLLGWGGSSTNPDKHRRGQTVIDANQVSKMVKTRGEAYRFSLGTVPFPRRLEDRSILLVGAPASGKSQAIQTVLDAIALCGDRAIITDPSAQFMRRYLKEDSIILNPLDARSVPWSPFAEFKEETYELDARTIAQSLVPTAESASAEEWRGFVRSFLRDILTRLWETDHPTNAQLNHFARIAGINELRELLAGTPSSANLLGEGGDKLLGSIRTTGDPFLDPISLLDPTAGKDSFSVREWTLNGKGWLFVTYQQNRRAMLAPLIGAVLNVYSDTMLTRKISKNRADGERVWGVFDEFPLLGRISSIESLLTNGSKHGFAGLIGIQTVAQLRDTYGQHVAQTILACLGTWLVLRCNDAETAQYMAQQAGKEEIMRTTQSGGSSDNGNSTNWSQQVVNQDVLLPSEIQGWPDLRGVLNLAGDYPLCPIKLSIVGQVDDKCDDFVLKSRGRAPAQPVDLIPEAGLELPAKAAENKKEVLDF